MAKYQYREARTPASKGKKLSHMEVHPPDGDGNHIVCHVFEDNMMKHSPEEHVFSGEEGDEALEG
jgi:hypothetical protein